MQLYTKKISPRRQKIGKYLIECLEESGYLKMDMDELAKGIGLSKEELEREIRFMQTLKRVFVVTGGGRRTDAKTGTSFDRKIFR